MTRLTLALILSAFPAFAETEGWNGDDPVDPPTVTPETPVTVTTPNGGSAYDPAGEVFYRYCLCSGEYAVARGFSLRTNEFREQAAQAQCETLNVKRQCAITAQEYGAGVLK